MHSDAQRLRERIAAGDVLAVIEASELVDRLVVDGLEVNGGDSVDYDGGDAITRAGLDDVSVALSIIMGESDETDARADAVVLAALYRLHGGREVRWTPDGVLVPPAGRRAALRAV